MERMSLSNDVVTRDDERPQLGEYDLLTRGDTWVALSDQEAVAVRLLLDRFGCVVGRERLTAALWPHASCSPSLLNQVIVRVRRRIEPLGLEVATVRRRGYVLRDQVA